MPGGCSRRTFAYVTPSARRQKTCGGTTGLRRRIFIALELQTGGLGDGGTGGQARPFFLLPLSPSPRLPVRDLEPRSEMKPQSTKVTLLISFRVVHPSKTLARAASRRNIIPSSLAALLM